MNRAGYLALKKSMKPASRTVLLTSIADEPTEIKLHHPEAGAVIPGWREGLQLMKPGAVFRFVIPPELAYGPRPAGPKIPANSTLVFWVKLVRIVD